MGGKASKPSVNDDQLLIRGDEDHGHVQPNLPQHHLHLSRDEVIGKELHHTQLSKGSVGSMSAEVGAAFQSAGLKIQTFRDPKKVSGGKREHLAMTLKGTVRQRRERVRLGIDKEPILKELIQLPQGEDLNDWLAVNTIHFFNIASMVYGTCFEFCTEESCPKMSVGAKFEFLWADGVKVKKPIQVSARKYMDLLFDYIEDQISNPAIFPSNDDDDYPPEFIEVVKTIFKRIFRMYGHIYYSHFSKVCESGVEAQLNSSFQHFAFFLCEFGLVDGHELRPLRKLLKKLVPGFE